MASETVDPIDWSHPPPTWAVPPERLVHSINQCTSATAGIERATLQPSACEATTYPYAATQGTLGPLGRTVHLITILACVVHPSFAGVKTRHNALMTALLVNSV